MTSCSFARRFDSASASTSGVWRHLGIERRARSAAATGSRSGASLPSSPETRSTTTSVGVLPAESEQLAQQLAPRRCTASSSVYASHVARRTGSRRRRSRSSSEQPRLADAGLADDLDERDRCRAHARAERRAQRRDLVARARRAASPRARSSRDGRASARPDRPRLHWLRLALHDERLQLGRSRTASANAPAPPRSRRSAPAAPWPSAGPRGSPRRPSPCSVRRYGGPMSPANTGPRFTPIRTGIARSPSTIRRSASSIRSSSSPVARGAPAVRISLPPSASTSEAEEADAVARRRPACVSRDEPVELVGDRLRPLALDQLVGPVEMHERDRRPAGARARRRRRAGARGSRPARSREQQLVGDVGQRPARPTAARRRVRTAGSSRVPSASPDARPPGSAPARRRADHDLARARRSPPSRRPASPPGPVTSSSRCEPPTRKKSNVPVWTPDRHPQRSPCRRGSRSCRPSRSARRMPSAARAARAAWSRRIAAVNKSRSASPPNFSRPAAFRRRREQVGEARADRVGHLLGAHPAGLRQPLGELREPGDVDEHHRAVDRALHAF